MGLPLMFTTLLANSADDNLMIFFLISPENRFWHSVQIVSDRIWHFMQIASNGDNLHEMSNPDFWEK